MMRSDSWFSIPLAVLFRINEAWAKSGSKEAKVGSSFNNSVGHEINLDGYKYLLNKKIQNRKSVHSIVVGGKYCLVNLC